MAGAEEAFRVNHPDFAAKVDGDPAIDPIERATFWAELDTYEPGEADVAYDLCCENRQMMGADVALLLGEELGHAPHRFHLVNNLSQTADPDTGLPPPSRDEVEILLNRITTDPDRSDARALFERYFGAIRLAPMLRIYAFRGDPAGIGPLQVASLPVIFERLAIPHGNPDNHVLLAFRPEPGAAVKIPTCFDARMRNMGLFQPGGMTAPAGLPGLPEVVTPPPLCASITDPPRRIA